MAENKKHRYYFFTEKSFTEDSFENDEAALDAVKLKPDTLRVMRAHDSKDIWTKPPTK